MDFSVLYASMRVNGYSVRWPHTFLSIAPPSFNLRGKKRKEFHERKLSVIKPRVNMVRGFGGYFALPPLAHFHRLHRPVTCRINPGAALTDGLSERSCPRGDGVRHFPSVASEIRSMMRWLATTETWAPWPFISSAFSLLHDSSWLSCLFFFSFSFSPFSFIELCHIKLVIHIRGENTPETP